MQAQRNRQKAVKTRNYKSKRIRNKQNKHQHCGGKQQVKKMVRGFRLYAHAYQKI